MGVLGAQPPVRILPSAILFIFANGDGRADPTWVRLYGACGPPITIPHTFSDLLRLCSFLACLG